MKLALSLKFNSTFHQCVQRVANRDSAPIRLRLEKERQSRAVVDKHDVIVDSAIKSNSSKVVMENQVAVD